MSDESAHVPTAWIVAAPGRGRALAKALVQRNGFTVAAEVSTYDELRAATANAAAETARPDLVAVVVGEGLPAAKPALAGLEQTAWCFLTPDPRSAAEALRAGAACAMRFPDVPRPYTTVLGRLAALAREIALPGRFVERIEPQSLSLVFHPRTEIHAQVARLMLIDLETCFGRASVPSAEIQLALHEALANAFEHGNLGITFDEKESAMGRPGGVRALIAQRLSDPSLAERKVAIRAVYDADGVVFRIEDQGAGFDVRRRSSAPMAPATALHGRGIKLILHVMDEVRWNENGTEIAMSKTIRRRGGHRSA